MYKIFSSSIKIALLLGIGMVSYSAFAGNIIDNSGFEVGLAGWGQDEQNKGYALADGDIVTSQSKDGLRSLQLYSTGGTTDRVIRVTTAGYRLEPGEAYTLSAWVKKSSSSVTGSLVMRISNQVHTEYQGSVSGTNTKIQFNDKSISLNDTVLPAGAWTRFDVSIPEIIPTVNPNGRVYDIYRANFIPQASGDGEIWIDSVQIEKSASATAYTPAYTSEVGTIFPSIDSAFIYDAAVAPTCQLRLFNHSSLSSTHSLHWSVENLFDEVISESMVPETLTAAQGELDELTLTLPNSLGAFRLILTDQGSGMIHEKIYSVLPAPRTFTDPSPSYAGAFMNVNSKESVDLMEKAGYHQANMLRNGGWFRWNKIRTLSSQFRKGSIANPEEGRDEIRAHLQYAIANDIRIIGVLGGIRSSFLPSGIELIDGLPVIEKSGDSWDSADPQGSYDETKDDYKEYVTDVVEAYKNEIDTWIIEDEADNGKKKIDGVSISITAQEYARYHHAAYQVISSIYGAMDPPKPVDIVLSSRPRSYVEAVELEIENIIMVEEGKTAAEVEGRGRQEISGVQRTNQGVETISDIKEWIDLQSDGRYWIDGKTVFNASFYTQYAQHNRSDDFDNFVTVRSQTQEQFNVAIAKMQLGYKHWLHYEATYLSPRIFDYDSKSIFEYDGGMGPKGVAYSSIWKRLDGSTHLGIGTSGDSSKWSLDRRAQAILFDQSQDSANSNYVLAVILRNTYARFNGSISSKMSLTFFDQDVSNLTFLDGFGNVSVIETTTPSGQTHPNTTVYFNDLGFFVEGSKNGTVLDQLEDLADDIEVKGNLVFHVLPWGISSVDHHSFAAVIDNSNTQQYRIFAHGHELLTGEKAHLKSIKTFEATAVDFAQTRTLKNIEDGHTIYTILSKDQFATVAPFSFTGTVTYERWISLTGDECDVKLRFSNSSPTFGGLSYSLGILNDIALSNTTGNITNPSFIHTLNNGRQLEFNFSTVTSDPVEANAAQWKVSTDPVLGDTLTSKGNYLLQQDGWIERQFMVNNYGLLGHWRLDEPSGTIVVDSSARDNSGTSTGTTAGHYAIERTGHYFENDAKVEIDNSATNPDFDFANNRSFTVSVWASDENDLGTNTWGPVVVKGSRRMAYSSQYLGWGISRFGTKQNKFQFTVNDDTSNGNGYVTINKNLSPGFHHLVMVVDRVNQRLIAYADGVIIDDKDITNVGNIDDSNKPINFGFSGETGASFIGLIDDVRLYDYVLTSDQIADLHAAGQVDLLGHWPLDDLESPTVIDIAKNQNGVNTGASISETGILGSAYYFENDAKVEITDSADNPNFNFADNRSFTVSVWASDENDLSTNTWGPVAIKGSRRMAYASQYLGWGISRFGTTQNKFRFTVNDDTNTSNGYVTIDKKLSSGFHHLVMVVDRVNQRLIAYADGVVIDDKDITNVGNIDDSNKPVNLGFSGETGASFIGPIDDMRIYNRPLTSNEILDLYEARN